MYQLLHHKLYQIKYYTELRVQNDNEWYECYMQRNFELIKHKQNM